LKNTAQDTITQIFQTVLQMLLHRQLTYYNCPLIIWHVYLFILILLTKKNPFHS